MLVRMAKIRVTLRRDSGRGKAMGDERYYERREKQERAMAQAARDPHIRALHEELADRYAEQGQQMAKSASN